MLLVNVQNPQTKENKLCIVLPDCIDYFLEYYVPAGCIALVQDCPVYLAPDFNVDDYLAQVAPNVFSECSDFNKKWYGKEK